MDGSGHMVDTSKAAELYNSRFEEYGKSIKTVGWGSAQDQNLRFQMLFRGLDPRGKRILDLGCGLADLIPFLEEVTGGDFWYVGIDIAEKLVESAKETYGSFRKEYYVGDIFSATAPKVDIAVMSGALTYRTEGIEEYAYRTMAKMFEISDEAACLNFLTKYVDYELDKNQHYQPEEVFLKAKFFSKKVNLFHDYPLYEFTVQLKK